MTYVACLFGGLLLCALMVLGSLALYSRRPNKSAAGDQWAYPLSFFAGVVALFNAAGLAATGLIALVVKLCR